MSENLDLVRSICADWERGDFSSAEWADPEIELVAADGPSPGSWKGLACMAAYERMFLSTWADYRIEVEQYCELEDERVLAFVRPEGRGKLSGVKLGQLAGAATLFHIRDGKVARLVIYADRDRALADLGLEE